MCGAVTSYPPFCFFYNTARADQFIAEATGGGRVSQRSFLYTDVNGKGSYL